MQKSLVLILALILSFSMFSLGIHTVRAGTIIVPDNYPTIQQAINAAADGDTIFVRAGTYNENVVINKKVSVIGENRLTTIIDGGGNGNVVLMTSAAESANISSLTVRNGRGLNDGAGIDVQGSNYHVITDNVITDNEFGLRLYPSHYNMIYNNEITSNIETGIELRSSLSNSIFNNTVSENGFNVWAIRSSNNDIVDNDVTKGGWGISLTESFNNTLRTNSIDANRYNLAVSGVFIQHYIQDIDLSNLVNGKAVYYLVNEKNLVIDSSTFPLVGYIGFVNCENMSVRNLSLEANAEGIILANTNSSLVENLRINDVSVGIDVGLGSSNNTIRNNIVFWCELVGIGLGNLCCNNSIYQNEVICLNSGIRTISSSNYNLMYHNTFIQYYPQQMSTSSINVWDNGLEGNFWSDYNGTDSNGDGVGDTPYVIDSSNQDNYPLMSPYIIGDINHDGVTNIFDVVKIVIAYNSDPASPGWNPHCDLNEDGRIDMLDLVVVTINFGSQWPLP